MGFINERCNAEKGLTARPESAIDNAEIVKFREAIKNSSTATLTKFALATVTGKLSFPKAEILRLNTEDIKNLSSVSRYGLYATAVGSLYNEHKGGFMTDQEAAKRAQEIHDVFTKAQDGRELHDTFFREKLKFLHIPKLPEELDQLLKDIDKLKTFPEKK